ncbi:hypothetical protein HNV12_09985 [Methanococcoides sp. SA1]|nr:hypothetical protein [Methanococcoides sp. SA1]
MDYDNEKQSIINLIAINCDQTGHEEMEIAEIASHLRLPVDHIEKAICSLVETGMARKSRNDRYAALLQKGYAESQRS